MDRRQWSRPAAPECSALAWAAAPEWHHDRMAGISYEEVRRRLTPAALQLFREMVDAHLAAGPGEKLFIRADSMGGTGLIFTGKTARRDWEGFDGAALDDMVSYGLLHLNFGGRGTPKYRVGGEAIAFHRWLMQQEGSAVDQLGEQVQRFVTGSDFAADHADAAHHLRQAFELLWGGRTDDQVVSEVGDHLRKALMDVTTDIVGSSARGKQERPIERLRAHFDGQTLSERERNVLAQLVELARVALCLDHRLNHIRDESDRGRPVAGWEEIRRAAFVTALLCYELSRA
jgi:hypothetical protein